MVEVNQLIRLVQQCTNSMSSYRLDIFRTNKKADHLKKLKSRVKTLGTKKSLLRSDEAEKILRALVKITFTPRSNDVGIETSSGKALVRLINADYRDLRELVLRYLNYEMNHRLTYQDLKTFATNFDASRAIKKRREYFGSWREAFDSDFSLVNSRGYFPKEPGHWTKYKDLIDYSWSNDPDVESYELPKDSEAYQQIESYISQQIQNQSYVSQEQEAARMVNARWLAENGDISHQMKVNLLNRLCEGESGGPRAPYSTEIEIEKIEAIVNPELWDRYINRRSELESNILGHEKQALKKIRWSSETEYLPVVDSNVGEAMLLHQISPGVEHLIAKYGFDPTRGRVRRRRFVFGGEIETKGMMGEGTYFSDLFSKCMTYSLCPVCGKYICNCESDDALRVTLFCRVLVGVPKNRPGVLKPSERTRMRALRVGDIDGIGRHALHAKRTTGSPRHLLTSGAASNEFAIQDSSQMYPEFAIYWKPVVNQEEQQDRVRVNLGKSHFGNTIRMNLPRLQGWEEYWNQEAGFSIDLWSIICRDVINRPYADDNFFQHTYRTFYRRNDRSVYRYNHGNVHAMRQLMYVKTLIRLIYSNGTKQAADILGAVSEQEFALLELATVLCRAGRSNEKGHRGDPSYSIRSANIFSLVAAELRFPDYYISNNMEMPGIFWQIVALQKCDITFETEQALLIKDLIDLSHHIDLLRVHKQGDIYQYTMDRMQLWFETETAYAMTVLFIDYARSLCYVTGDRISYLAYAPNHKRKDLDNELFVELSNNLDACLDRMQRVVFGERLHGVKPLTLSFPKDAIEDRSERLDDVILEEVFNCVDCSRSIIHDREKLYCDCCTRGFFCRSCVPDRETINTNNEVISIPICNDCYESNYFRVEYLQ